MVLWVPLHQPTQQEAPRSDSEAPSAHSSAGTTRLPDGWLHGWIDEWMCRWMGRWVDGWVDRWVDE